MPTLTPRAAGGASVTPTESGWRLEIPAGPRRQYRLAQLDDYAGLPRRAFAWKPPLTLNLRAHLCAPDLPGTWGFGLWNDPFGFSLGFGGAAGRLPALPNCAWFFHASPENHLSLRGGSNRRRSSAISKPDEAISWKRGEIASGKDRPRNDVPANGFFAGAFRSPRLPSLLFAAALPALPLLAIRPLARLMRRALSLVVRQDAARIEADVTQWHEYQLSWLHALVRFEVDGKTILETSLTPHPPLALVLWIDNQYAAFTPEGRLGYGTLENPAAWLEIENIATDGLPLACR